MVQDREPLSVKTSCSVVVSPSVSARPSVADRSPVVHSGATAAEDRMFAPAGTVLSGIGRPGIGAADLAAGPVHAATTIAAGISSHAAASRSRIGTPPENLLRRRYSTADRVADRMVANVRLG